MPSPRTRTSLLLACLLTAALAYAPPGRASTTQETILQDDPKIVFANSEEALDLTLSRVKALGVDRIRVSVFWYLVAPNPRSRRRPSFGQYGPTWPGSYPESAWQRYDRLVSAAQRHGLGVLMSVTGPAPRWAAGGGGARESIVRPNSDDFRDFVTAVGARYSGYYS